MTRLHRALAYGTVALLAAAAPRRQWILPTAWPVERMVANLERYVEAHPRDAEGHFVLGRVHALAFTLEATELGLWSEPSSEDGRELLFVATDEAQRIYHTKQDEHPGEEKLRNHLRAGIRNLRRANELKRRHGAARMSLAYLIDHGAHLAPRLDTAALFDVAPVELSEEEGPALQARVTDLGSEVEATRRAAFEALRAQLETALPHLQAAARSSNATQRAGAAALLERFWKERAIEHYRSAFEMAAPQDLQLDHKPLSMRGDGLHTLISYEAGRAWIRLVEERGARDEAEREALLETRAVLEKLESLPVSNIITPIVLALEETHSLDELLLAGGSVLFDLDGDGLEEAWPWLRPGAGFLVWDPDRTGRVTSGRQMFGTMSAQLLFSDGYRALDALDDDRDGTLSRDELTGLALWFDRDCDGWSAPGEVVPVESLGIVALATQAITREGPHPANPCGVVLADGRVLPSYDWVTAASLPAR